MPECGPEEESFMAPGVLLAHHSECLNQPRRYQVPWPAWHCLQQLVQEHISPVVPFSGLSSCFAHFTPDVLSSFLKHARQTPAPGPSCCISAWNTAPQLSSWLTPLFHSALYISCRPFSRPSLATDLKLESPPISAWASLMAQW